MFIIVISLAPGKGEIILNCLYFLLAFHNDPSANPVEP